VKLPDLNLLLYAVDEGAPRHTESRSWLEEILSGTESVAFAWVVLLGFVRISTNAVVLEHPLGADEALDYVNGWLEQPVAEVVHPTSQHASILRKLLQPLGAAGNLTSDAHLAALAIEHGAELHSCDADFSRFADLRWRDPLR
jgi:toxin-antitoxin system PIN domain toxin